MPRATGIQLAGNRIRAVELRGWGKSVKLARAVEFPLEGGADAFTAEVRGAFSGHRISRDPAVLLLTSSSLRIRSFPVPFQKDDQIRRVIKTVVEEHLPGATSEQVLVVFMKAADLEGEKSRVLAVVAGKEEVGAQLQRFAAAGIDPQVAECELSALFNWAAFAGAVPAEGKALIVDLEHDRVSAVITAEGRLVGMRSFRTGLASAAEAAPPLRPGVEAETGPGEAPGGAAEGAANPEDGSKASGDHATGAGEGEAPPVGGQDRTAGTGGLERIARELRRFMLAEGLEKPPDRAFATGSLSADPAGLSEISARLGLALEPLAAPAGFEDAPPWAPTAAGAALKLLNFDMAPMDFRQEEYSFRRKFDRIKWTAAALSLMFFLFFLALGANYQVRYSAERYKREEVIKDTQKYYFNTALPDEKLKLYRETGMRDMRNALKKRMEQLTGKGADRDVPQLTSALSRWREMADRIRSAQGIKYLTVERLTFEPRGFALEGEVDSAAALDSLLNTIKSTPGLDQAQHSKPPKLEGERYRFGIRAEIKEKEQEAGR